MDSELAFRFQYADKSAFEVYENGECYISFPNGRREQKHGVITNNIPILIAKAVEKALRNAGI